MDLTSVNPSDMIPADAKDLAGKLVGFNNGNIADYAGRITDFASQRALANEEQLAAIYRPLTRLATRQVAANDESISAIDATLGHSATAQVLANKSMLAGIKERLGVSNVTVTGDAVTRPDRPLQIASEQSGQSTGFAAGGSIPQTMPELPTGILGLPTNAQPTTNVGTPASGIAIDDLTLATIGSIPTFVQGTTSQIASPSRPSYGQTPSAIGTKPIPQIPGYVITPIIDQQGIVTGQFVTPVTIPPVLIVPTQPPSGSDYCTVDGQPICPPTPDMPVCSCPPGSHRAYDPVAGIYKCILDNPSGPLCSAPPNFACEIGTKWVWSTSKRVWECKPTAEIGDNTIEDDKPCPEIEDKVGIHVSMNCGDLPEKLRKHLEDCGYSGCEVGDKVGRYQDDGLDSLWDMLAEQMAELEGAL